MRRRWRAGSGTDGYRELLGALDRRARALLGCRRARPRHPVRDAVRTRARRLGRPGMGALVHRRPAQPRPRLRRALGRRPGARRRRGDRLRRTRKARTRSLTYAELAREVARCAEGLEALGVRSGDAVALLMPMAPEVAIAYYAVAAIGALVVPIFSGFSASAVASRLEDSRAVALITVDAFMRARPAGAREGDRGRGGCRAHRACATVVVVRHTGAAGRVARRAATSGGTSSSRAGPGRAARRRSTASTRSCSPTPRARPAGPRERCTCTAGSSSRSRARAATQCDLQPGDRCHWMTDIGWIMGPVAAGQRPRPRR